MVVLFFNQILIQLLHNKNNMTSFFKINPIFISSVKFFNVFLLLISLCPPFSRPPILFYTSFNRNVYILIHACLGDYSEYQLHTGLTSVYIYTYIAIYLSFTMLKYHWYRVCMVLVQSDWCLERVANMNFLRKTKSHHFRLYPFHVSEDV